MGVTNFENGLAIDGVKIPAHAVITVGAESANVVNVAIQLYADAAGQVELDSVAGVDFYLSDDSGGAGIAATAPSGGIAIGTDGDYIEYVSGKAGKLFSESDGDIDVDVTEVGTDTFYLVVVLPTGKRIVSTALTFAA